METKTRIKVEYDIENKTADEILEIDAKIMAKIKSIGGKWWAQGSDFKTRDICFDLVISNINKKSPLGKIYRKWCEKSNQFFD